MKLINKRTKINDGDTVEYKATEGKRGLTAVDVSRVWKSYLSKKSKRFIVWLHL